MLRLNIGMCSVITIGMTYIVASTLASGVFVVAGRRSRQAQGVAPARGMRDRPTDPLWGEAETGRSSSQPLSDVGDAMRLALRRLAPVLVSRSVQVEIAAPPGLSVRMRSAALTELLEDVLTAAVHGAPASRLLLTAAKYGDGIYVRIADDMPAADLTVRMGSVRILKERVAMRGGALHVDVRPNEGAILTLRLPGMIQDKEARALPEPAKGPAAPLIPLMEGAHQLR
jgi:hypothetical protein